MASYLTNFPPSQSYIQPDISLLSYSQPISQPVSQHNIELVAKLVSHAVSQSSGQSAILLTCHPANKSASPLASQPAT